MIRHPKPKSILRKRRIKRQPTTGNKFSKNITGTDASEVETPKKRHNLRFAGPIKIIVVDPKSEYCKTVWCAIGIALTNVALGAVLMTVLHYSIAKGDAHVAVCAFGCNFFIAEAILALHYANGWSAPMRTRHKKCAHFFLNMCGILCVVIGTTVVFLKNEVSATAHGISGIISVTMLILSAIIGPIAFRIRKTWLTTLHMSIGIPAFIMSSLCACFGFTLQSFNKWASDATVYMLIGLVLFYTVFIVTSSFIKCMSKL